MPRVEGGCRHSFENVPGAREAGQCLAGWLVMADGDFLVGRAAVGMLLWRRETVLVQVWRRTARGGAGQAWDTAPRGGERRCGRSGALVADPRERRLAGRPGRRAHDRRRVGRATVVDPVAVGYRNRVRECAPLPGGCDRTAKHESVVERSSASYSAEALLPIGSAWPRSDAA